MEVRKTSERIKQLRQRSIRCLLILLFVIFLIVVFLNIKKSSFNTSSRTAIVTPQSSSRNPLCELEYTNQGDFTVQSNLVKMADVGSFREISVNNQTIVVPSASQEISTAGISYSPKLNQVAYVDTTSNNRVTTDIVYLYDLSTKQKEAVYQMQELSAIGKGEYVKKITGVSFSGDSTMLGITTGESFIIYQLETKQIRTVFQDQREASSFGVFGYNLPFSWPIGNKVYLNESYYEGSGSSIYDLESQQKTSLNYSYYASGKKVLGIFDNEMIVASTVLSTNSGFETSTSKIYLVNINTLDQTLIGTFDGSIYPAKVTPDGYLYFGRVRNEYINAYTCYKDNAPYHQETTLSTLTRLNLKTKKYTELLTADAMPSTKGASKDMSFLNLYVSEGSVSKQILVTMRWGDVPVDFLLNEDSPKYLTQLYK